MSIKSKKEEQKINMNKKVPTSNSTQILEGSRTIALTILNIGPDVISAYPITPQTHIVEDLAKFKANGKASYEYIRAESEFAAASIILGASATGVRSYTATSSQGLLLMSEVLHNLAGLRLPAVITCANRAISGPINIWNDHSDAMALKDSGLIQLFAETNQEAVYQHILAYRLSELSQIPVMVNVDGFLLTHAYEAVTIPNKKEIKKYLAKYQPEKNTYLNPKHPITIGGFFDSDSYFKTRQELYLDMQKSSLTIKQEWKNLQKDLNFKSKSNGLIEYIGPKNAKNIFVAMGSVCGTIRELVKKQTDTALLKISAFRPFPQIEIVKALKNNKNILVIDKALGMGNFGPLASEIKAAFSVNGNNKKIVSVVAGLGGKDINQKNILKLLSQVDKKIDKTIFIS